jgi:hypothetical protein
MLPVLPDVLGSSRKHNRHFYRAKGSGSLKIPNSLTELPAPTLAGSLHRLVGKKVFLTK